MGASPPKSAPSRAKRAPAGDAVGACPLCRGQVVADESHYRCVGGSSGCRFAISKTIAGKEISLATARALLQRGRTGMIAGFQSAAGQSFSARLKIENGAVRFEFGR